MALISFTPSASTTIALTTTQNNAQVNGTGHYLRLCNGGSGNAFVTFYQPPGPPPTISAATSLLIPSGAIEIFAVASDQTAVAALGDATGTSLNITRGEGQ